ncbi:MAG: M28 family peptidase [Hyphomicrobiaceae bacterium]
MPFVWGLLLTLLILTGAAIRFCVVFPRQPSKAAAQPLDDGLRASALALEAHIRAVASQPHNIAHPAALEASATYIELTLKSFGYTPVPQTYRVGNAHVRNIEVIIDPPAPARATKTFVIGAHYDSADDFPGANDNGTGVAALLELARTFHDATIAHRLRLVFFVNEEHPYGKTPDMGSFRHANAMRERGENIVGMLALETLGHFSEQPGSQRFPFPFGLLYPNRGNFIAFVGMLGARTLVNHCVHTFRAGSSFPAIGSVAPSFVEGADLSDHWAYDHFGYPACMVTDTAPFRNPFYHSARDTPDTVDYANLARITAALATMISTLAEAQRTTSQLVHSAA